MLYCTTLTTQ